MQNWTVPVVYCKKGQKHLEDDHPVLRSMSWIGTHTAFAFEVAAALVLCGLNALVSIPAASITERIHLEIVSLETCL